ncbi:MAG: glycerophosphodiester phosphodiesterase family protein [Pseudomonadota bacterium]|nr:glycerophosphodiester phosphodiesterase family protein [Pseudomonadota bacterium]
MRKIQIHGHRGARGLWPENTLAGFAAAIESGVDAIEMDVCFCANEVLVLSHDLALSPCLSRDRAGAWLQPPTPVIHDLTLRQLRGINVGAIDPACRYAERWPEQRTLPHASIPTLAEVVKLAGELGARDLVFNIEPKSDPYHPEQTPAAEDYARLLLAEIGEHGIGERLFLQSFDWNLLAALRELQPDLEPGYLTSRQPDFNTLDATANGPSLWTAGHDIKHCKDSIPRMVKAAGGKIWSSNHLDLTPARIAEAHDLGLVLYTWTVNEESTMRWMLTEPVAAITTDYPPRLRQIMLEMGL